MRSRRRNTRDRIADEQSRDDMVRVDVGFDRFHAHLLSEACRNEGYVVELLTMDDLGTAPGVSAGVPHELLVRTSALEKVRAVLARIR